MNIAAIVVAVLNAVAPHTPAPQVVCYPTAHNYFTAARIPAKKFWPGGVAGFWGYPAGSSSLTIGLTRQECANLAALRTGYTWQRGYSVFVLGHEITHAINGSDEHAADCGGLALQSRIAYMLGLRGHAQFQQLAVDNRRDVLGTAERCP